jgi:hypothetical protein
VRRAALLATLSGALTASGPPRNRVKLELVGSDPNFLRTSNGRFSVRVSRLRVVLPTR